MKRNYIMAVGVSVLILLLALGVYFYRDGILSMNESVQGKILQLGDEAKIKALELSEQAADAVKQVAGATKDQVWNLLSYENPGIDETDMANESKKSKATPKKIVRFMNTK